MKILFIWPPHIPSYFNAGHHLPLFQTGEYIRKNIDNADVTCVDAGALNYTWKEIADLLSQNKFDLIAIMNDFDSIDTFPRLIRYIIKLSNNSRIITFGRLSKYIPDFFKKYKLDAIIFDGDYEASVKEYIDFLYNKNNTPRGVIFKSDNKWYKGDKGIFLSANEWEFPNLSEIPYNAYDYMYKNDKNKFCGIPNRRELVINVSRGCPVGCEFCDVQLTQGNVERRISASLLANYIEKSFDKFPFEYVSFYSPTFTLNREWVLEFCDLISKKDKVYPWKCVTTVQNLEYGLIEKMSKAGCIRISVGVETLDEYANKSLPKIKRNIINKLINLIKICNKFNIELNCFIILGLPGETTKGVIRTISLLKKYKVRIRPTIYTPYYKLDSSMSLEEISSFNRQLFLDDMIDEKKENELYKIFFDNDQLVTEVYKKIEKRS